MDKTLGMSLLDFAMVIGGLVVFPTAHADQGDPPGIGLPADGIITACMNSRGFLRIVSDASACNGPESVISLVVTGTGSPVPWLYQHTAKTGTLAQQPPAACANVAMR